MSLIWPIVTQALRCATRTAVVDDRGQYTYAQLLGGAMHLAEHIDAATSNRHIGLMFPTSGAFPMGLLGAWLAQRAAVPLNYLLSAEELAYIIRDSGIDTLFSARVMIEHLTAAHGSVEKFIPPEVRVVLIDELDFTGAPPLRWPPIPPDDELAVLLYTSGTSGRPKGVMLSHGNLHSDVDAAIEHARISQVDTFLGVLPQFHSFGLTGLTLLPLRVGATVVYTARFQPKKIIQLIRKHHPDIFMAVPSMYGALLTVKEAGPDDFASIRLAVSGGEPLPQATYETYLDRFHLKLLEGYGLTETAPITNWSTPWDSKRHSVGRSLPGVKIVIVDDHDRPLPPNQGGEILITGPVIMLGYYNLPQQTAEVFIDLDINGSGTRRYFRSGDIGHLDEDGFLYITGRKKEMLIVGGENVFPREIEEVLNKHESVKDSAVIGKMDGTRGEVPVAFIELCDGAEFDDKALRSWCRDQLAGYKVPRAIHVVDTLPRGPTGKIMRRELVSRQLSTASDQLSDAKAESGERNAD